MTQSKQFDVSSWAGVGVAPQGLEVARQRLQLTAIAVAVVSTFFRPLTKLELSGLGDPAINAELLIIVISGLALDAALFLVARRKQISHRTALDFALVYELLRCFLVALAMTRIHGLAGLQAPAVTFGSAGLLLFPLIIPMRPARALMVSLMVAATQPLALVFSPLPVPLPIVVESLMVSAVAVPFAMLCGRVGYSLSARAAHGAELGSYHLDKLISRDEGGELWQASHRLLARPAVIRVFRQSLVGPATSARTLARFRQEAELASTLTSPHTQTLYDYGASLDGGLYAAMEPIDGESLAGRIEREGPMSPEQVIAIGRQMSDSIAEAHGVGLVHRALDPASVFLCRVGRRRDFVKLTTFGNVVGEITLAAPGRLSANQKQDDLAQLGSTLYYALTGRIIEPQEVDGRALSSVIPGVEVEVPQPLRGILGRLMSDDATDHYPSALALLKELDSLDESSLPAEAPSMALPRPKPRDEERRSTPTKLRRSSWLLGSSFGSRDLQLLTVIPKEFGEPTKENRERPSRLGLGQLSPELFETARFRLGRIAAITAGFTMASTLGVFVLFRPQVVGSLEALALATALSVALDLVLLFMVPNRRFSTSLVLDTATWYFVLRCSLIAYATAQAHLVLGLEMPTMTFASSFLMLLPAFLPGRPSQIFLACVFTVVAYSLVLASFSPGGRLEWMLLATYSILAFVSSLFTTVIMYRLNTAASRARTYGTYQLTSRIARGAMGEVWEAKHELLARPAAVKLIYHRRSAPQDIAAARRRFEAEAYITAHLTSANTVTLYDYGVSASDDYYYVMELLDGEDLDSFVQQNGPLSPVQAIGVALQVCDSLAEAHARGLIHRDLKPANVFLCRAGCYRHFVKVLDFGLAELVARLSRSGDVRTLTRTVGTPHFMAPEVFVDAEIDERSDLYQLGCILFFLLTGEVVFPGRDIAGIAYAHAYTPAPRVSTRASQPIPPGLDDLIARCLEKDPADRFASVDELEQALLALRPSGAALRSVGDTRSSLEVRGPRRAGGKWLSRDELDVSFERQRRPPPNADQR